MINFSNRRLEKFSHNWCENQERAHELRLQVAGQGFDHAFAPAVGLLALGNELAQVPVQLHLLLVYLLESAVLGGAHALLHLGEQLLIVGGVGFMPAIY